MLNAKLVQVVATNYPEVIRRVNSQFLPAAGAAVTGETKRIIRAKKIVDTGRLRDSIGFNVSGDQVSVGTNVEYSPYIEYGTVRQTPRPFLRPALDAQRKGLVGLWRNLFRKAFRAIT